MAITDQTLLSEIQRVTLEGAGDGGATWPSGMWTQAEVLGALNQRQNRFLALTGLVWSRDETAIVAGQSNQDAPSDWAATLLIAYGSGAGVYRMLDKLDAYELDLARRSWPGETTAAKPAGYYEIDGATLTTYVVPIPTDAASVLERYYVALGTALDASGVNFSVPDECVPTLKYGCLAELFGKIGPAQNLPLAAACEERWEEGVELGRLIAGESWFTQ